MIWKYWRIEWRNTELMKTVDKPIFGRIPLCMTRQVFLVAMYMLTLGCFPFHILRISCTVPVSEYSKHTLASRYQPGSNIFGLVDIFKFDDILIFMNPNAMIYQQWFLNIQTDFCVIILGQPHYRPTPSAGQS